MIVSSSDNGAANCDNPNSPNNAPASGPAAVNRLASTPFNTAMGGTQFAENGKDANFWNPTNSFGFASAKGYIPENVWNESCDPTTPGATCPDQRFSLFAGSGGVSTLYSKPSWQTGQGVPADAKYRGQTATFPLAFLQVHEHLDPNGDALIYVSRLFDSLASAQSFSSTPEGTIWCDGATNLAFVRATVF